MEYNFKEIEAKWQSRWRADKTYKVETDPSRPKFYVLDMFPYPSGAGLHVGHPLGYIASDIYSRYKRLKGFNVLHPMGYDAFGLPAEQYAIQTGQHPAVTTEQNIARYREQLDKIGFSFDWDREVRTCDPGYYKWTQWAFLEMFSHWYDRSKQQARPVAELTAAFETSGTEGLDAACTTEMHFTAAEWNAKSEREKEQILQNYRLAFRADTQVNWCPKLGTVLANDEVHDGLSVRGGYPVEQKRMKQWLLRVTAYAQRMLDGLDKLEWSDSLKEIQRNWIGRSEGAQVFFDIENSDRKLEIFTTRPDTIFGVTFMVIAPEHEWVGELTTPENKAAVEEYIRQTKKRSERDRIADTKRVSGVATGSYAINPFTNKAIPIYISDYVLSGYGTGAIMAVPAHDSRDYAFARHFGLEIVPVVEGGDISQESYDAKSGKVINSDFLNGKDVKEAIGLMFDEIERRGLGRKRINYRLRDAIFSRQRYWGEPIPLVYCEKCGWQPIDESELPLLLPDVDSYEPTDDGESPLSKMTDWVNTTCPVCGAPAKRETDTMPQWAGSSWYFLRYMDPHCKDALASKEALEYWSPVDWYNGGMEHTTLHLLYSRFWHKFLYDIGVVPTAEPYQKRTAHGMILGLNPHSFVNLPAEEQEKLLKEYGSQKAAEKALEEKYGEMARHPIVKMSKSLGNVINPDEVVDQYGADTMRLYEMFMGDFEQAAPWQTSAIAGCNRFLDRVWALSDKLVEGEGYRPAMETLMHQTIKKVSADIESLKMNTAIAQLMTLVNAMYDNGGATKAEFETLVQLLNPFAPHMTEELWEKLGHSHDEQLAYYPWPAYEEAKCVEAAVEIAVQVNGKVKARLKVPADITAEDAIATAKADPAVAAALEGKQLVKEIYVKGRLVNLAAKG